jgi:hypothetical protein
VDAPYHPTANVTTVTPTMGVLLLLRTVPTSVRVVPGAAGGGNGTSAAGDAAVGDEGTLEVDVGPVGSARESSQAAAE